MADNTILTKIKAYFTTASTRENLTSGEELQTSLGKVKKWFSDLGTAAFTNSTDYAASSHNQASNTINAMTGYTKPQATSAITASDTLNEAIGKLEKAIDDAGGGGDDRQIYGFMISGTSIEYIADAFGKIPAHLNSDGTFDWGDWADAFFIPRPCMLKYDGTVDYYLDPNDYTKKEDGTPSDVNNIDYPGNAMMEFPLIYYSSSSINEGWFYVANYKVDDSYKCYCNYDYEGNVIPHFYTAIYQGTVNNNKTRSISGATPYTKTPDNSANAALLNNINSEMIEWYTDVYCDRQLISMLLVLISKSANLGQTFGRGYMDTTLRVTGSGDDKGLFYGVPSESGSLVKVFGMENFWGNKDRFLAGLGEKAAKPSSSSSISQHTLYAKCTWSTVDGSTVVGYNTSDISGYNAVCSLGSFASDPRVMSAANVGSKSMFLPKSLTSLTVSSDSPPQYFDTYIYRANEGSYAYPVTLLLGAGGYEVYDYKKYASNAYNKITSSTTLALGLSCKPHISRFQQEE